MDHNAFFNPLNASFKEISQNFGSYKWHIEDDTLINTILSCKCGEQFDSKVFNICKLKWVIRLYPNGWNDQNHGYCGVFAQLLEIPSSLKSIFCQLHIECPQIESKMSESVSYNKPFSFGSYISSFKQLKQYKPKQLTFNISIHITRIILKSNNQILYQMPTHKYSRNMRLQWTIDKDMMKKLKSFRKPKGICSKVYNDIWIIKLYPNGGSYSKDGEVEIGLEMCCLPSNIAAINVEWTLHCHELKIKQILKKEFGEDKCYWFWKSNHISFKQFLKYGTLTVSVDITVLKEIKYETNEYKEDICNDDLRASKFEVYDTSIRSMSDELQHQTDEIKKLRESVCQLSSSIQLISKKVKNQDNKMEKLAENASYAEDIKEDYYNKEMMKEISYLKQQISQILSEKQQDMNRHHKKVKEWLKMEVNLEVYYDVFIENGFEDLESIKTINMEILNMMRIDKIGHKMKILRCVSKLDNELNEGHIQCQEGNTAYK